MYWERDQTLQDFAQKLNGWSSHAGRGAPVKLGVARALGLRASDVLTIVRQVPFRIISLSFEASCGNSSSGNYEDIEEIFMGSLATYPKIKTLALSLPRLWGNQAWKRTIILDFTKPLPRLCSLTLDNTHRLRVLLLSLTRPFSLSASYLFVAPHFISRVSFKTYRR
jgi:hypothetical protein